MQGAKAYSYAVLRVVPRVERDEFINAGVILFSQEHRFLGAMVHLNKKKLRAFAPEVDIEAIERHLAVVPTICAGEQVANPIASLPQKDRFHWLTAPRSTMIQVSPIRTGLSGEPRQTLEHLSRVLVL